MDDPVSSPPGPMRLCGFCNKPFFQETPYNRHVLYCRRAQSQPRLRAKPCRACAKAKIKCSLQRRCQRCARKGLECVYDTGHARGAAAVAAAAAAASAMTASPTSETTTTTTTNATAPTTSPIMGSATANPIPTPITPQDPSHPMEQQPQPSVSHPTSSANSDTMECLDDMSTPSAKWTDSSHVSLDWDTLDFAVQDVFLQEPSLSSLSRSAFDSTFNVFSDGPPLAACSGDLVYSPDGDRDDRDDHDPDGGLLLTEMPGCEQDSSAFLIPLPISDPVAKFTANIVMRMLRAFPEMMLRRETFPPFIHGHWHCSSDDADATSSALPEPLVNCMGLAQVFASHTPETRTFLWRTVRAEQRSAAAKASQRQFSKYDHLAAIQALLIYIMMRVVDNSPVKPDLNLELLVTYQGLCHSFKDVWNEPFYRHERLYPSLNWPDWVFAESRRRTAIVWLLVTQMIQIKIGVPCDTFASFRDVPLSSPKALWEAKTRSEWESEYDVYRNMPRLGLDDFGDLYDACKNSNVAANQRKLHAWNATVDSLGIMLNLGAEIM